MPWLYQPADRAALCDVAKLAVTLRSGRIPREFLDEGFDPIELGQVGRVLLMAPAELGLPPSHRKFALARGTTRLCLAEIAAHAAGTADAQQHLDAVERQRAKLDARSPLVGWLIAPHIEGAARAILLEAGARGTSTGGP